MDIRQRHVQRQHPIAADVHQVRFHHCPVQHAQYGGVQHPRGHFGIRAGLELAQLPGPAQRARHPLQPIAEPFLLQVRQHLAVRR